MHSVLEPRRARLVGWTGISVTARDGALPLLVAGRHWRRCSGPGLLPRGPFGCGYAAILRAPVRPEAVPDAETGSHLGRSDGTARGKTGPRIHQGNGGPKR